MTCKVADFGLSRGATKVSEGDDGYYKSTNGVFPLRWTAPESMQSLRFSTASDVWSFAIVLVEVMQHGRIPYAGMSNREVILDVMKGYRIKQEQLGGCSTSLYIALMKCWKIKPEERPNFTELIANFEDLKEGKTLNGSVEVKEEALPEGYGGPSGDISESTYYDADGSATALANDAANASAATGDSYSSYVPVSTPPGGGGEKGPANPEPAYVGADGDSSGYVPLSTTQANRKRTETVYRTAEDAAAEMTTAAGGSERFSSGGSNDAAVYHTAEQATADQGYIGVSGAIDANGNPCTDCATEPNNYEYMSKEQVRRASQTADEFNDVIAESNLDCTPEDGYLSPAVLPVPELGSRKSQKKSSKGKMSKAKAADAAIKVDEAGYVEGSAIPEILAAGKAPPLPTTKKQTFGF